MQPLRRLASNDMTGAQDSSCSPRFRIARSTGMIDFTHQRT
jgi:hypothetical protein